MNCTDIKDQLVDFLYDELSADARTAFAAHLHGCAACSAEVASFQATLGSARSALAGPLAQEPPPRIRLSAIAAATVAAARSEDQHAEVPAKLGKPGFFARLLRTPWLLPAFGAASVATAVFLVRVLKNPEVFPVPPSQSTEEVAGQAAKPVLAPAVEAPVAKEKAPRAIQMAETKKAEPAKRMVSRGARAASAKAASTERFAQPPSPQPAPESVLIRMKKNMQLDEAGAAPSAPARAMAPVRPMAKGAVGDGLAGVAAPTNTAATTGADKRPRAASSHSSPSGAPSPAPAATLRPSSRRAEAEQATDEAAPYPQEEGVAKDEVSKSLPKADTTPSLAESTRKADRLFANQEWNAAADAYRDLLRRFPNDKDAPRWRERLRTATITVQNPKSEKAKAKTSDPLDGLKL
jgi:hypothetical protein